MDVGETGSQQVAAPTAPTQPAKSDEQADPERSKKLSYLEFTYKEVLDATKHQDDKIGRLLTVIAFLTAGALALANLAGGQVTAVFDMKPFTIPAGMLCLTIFLLLIFVTVVLLVAGFATPLRMPAQDSLDSKPIDWRSASQIYFNEIAKITTDDWKQKWKMPTDDLESERVGIFVRETHNLSVRTTFKYDRTNEAISSFSIALMAFALAASFVYLATTSSAPGAAISENSGPIEISVRGKILLALIVAMYAGVHLLSLARYRNQSIADVVANSRDDKQYTRRVRAERLFVVAFSAFVLTIAWPWSELIGPAWSIPIVSLVGIASLAAFVMSRKKLGRPGWLLSIAGLVASLTGAALALLTRSYGIQFLTAVVTVGVLLGLSALVPSVIRHQNIVNYRKSHPPTDCPS